jgi:hypothetical protein
MKTHIETVAVSISESPDMAYLGLAEEHLNDAMSEVARHMLVSGKRLVYGGDLRAGGFTEILFELVLRYRLDAIEEARDATVSNVLAYPVHKLMPQSALDDLREGVSEYAELILLDINGRILSDDDHPHIDSDPPTNGEWEAGLTRMREFVVGMSQARIVLGGRVAQFKGRMPGIAEEVLSSINAEQPVFLLGGFGGCTRDILEEIGFPPSPVSINRNWPGRDLFARIDSEAFHNGLSRAENEVLATTVHIEEAIALVLRGLLRLE